MKSMKRGLIRPAFAALAMGAAVAALLHWWPQPAGRASGYAALRLGGAVVLGGAIYLALAGRSWLKRRSGPATPDEPDAAQRPPAASTDGVHA